MPAAVDTQQRADDLARDNLHRKILAFASRHGLAEQLEPRILQPLSLPTLRECTHLQLKAIEHALQVVALYP